MDGNNPERTNDRGQDDSGAWDELRGGDPIDTAADQPVDPPVENGDAQGDDSADVSPDVDDTGAEDESNDEAYEALRAEKEAKIREYRKADQFKALRELGINLSALATGELALESDENNPDQPSYDLIIEWLERNARTAAEADANPDGAASAAGAAGAAGGENSGNDGNDGGNGNGGDNGGENAGGDNSGDGNNGANGDGGAPAVPVPVPVPTGNGENAGGDNGGDNGGENDDDDDETERHHEANEEETKHGRWRKFGKSIAAIVGLLATAASLTTLLGGNNKAVPETDIEASNVDVDEDSESEKSLEDMIADAYGEIREREVSVDESYRGVFANDNLDGYNTHKDGIYNHNENFDTHYDEILESHPNWKAIAEQMGNGPEAKAQIFKLWLADTAARQPETLASYVSDLATVRGLDPATAEMTDINELADLMKTNPDTRDRLYNGFVDWLEMADLDFTQLDSAGWNTYLRLNGLNDDNMVDTEHVEFVQYQTEVDAEVAVFTITLKDGTTETLTIKRNCCNEVGTNPRPGVPEIPPEENKQPETPDPDPEKPDPDPENPDPEDPDPEDPDPEDPDPEDPDPEDPDPENPDPENPDPENPDPENPDPDNPDPEDPDTPLKPKDPDNFKQPEGTFVDKDKPVGEVTPQTEITGDKTGADIAPEDKSGDIDPSPEVQIGGTTNQVESADGTGRTVEQVQRDADTSTTTETGEKVSEQVNHGKTEDGQPIQTVDEIVNPAGSQTEAAAADARQDQAEAVAGEIRTNQENASPEEQQANNANMFNNGLY